MLAITPSRAMSGRPSLRNQARSARPRPVVGDRPSRRSRRRTGPTSVAATATTNVTRSTSRTASIPHHATSGVASGGPDDDAGGRPELVEAVRPTQGLRFDQRGDRRLRRRPLERACPTPPGNRRLRGARSASRPVRASTNAIGRSDHRERITGDHDGASLNRSVSVRNGVVRARTGSTTARRALPTTQRSRSRRTRTPRPRRPDRIEPMADSV